MKDGEKSAFEYQKALDSTGLSYSLVTALLDVHATITATELFPVTAQRLRALLGADSVTVTLKDKEGYVVVAHSSPNFAPSLDVASAHHLVPQDSLTARLAEERRPLYWQQTGGSHHIGWLSLKHYLGIPIFDEQRLLFGSLVIGFSEEGGLNNSNVLLAEIMAETFFRAYQNSLNYSNSFLQGQVVEQERVAQELHDTIAQNVFGAHIKLEEVLRQATLDTQTRRDLQDVGEALAVIRDGLRSTIFDKPSKREVENSLAALIDAEVQSHKQRGGVTVATIGETDTEVSPQILAVTRAVVRESLTNIRKHAGAEHVSITLSVEGRYLNLVVRDDGCGAQGTSPALIESGFHFGLTNLRRLVEQVGGHFATGYADEDEGLGFAVLVRLPLNAVVGEAPHENALGRLHDPSGQTGQMSTKGGRT